ncbi:type-1 restriction enzyme StySJI specificity protein HsdS [Rhodovulum sulfidophilum]|uniref:Type-1 restriction enzyme StySJI specificity protein HsdS n=1 Tax=Rhodovulum sulfidophilum TaxID=35806 RepID=A0A0D6B0U1_RHOSU|nr:type-1 restriction enzyme StySJI specificity protein HsdS [Rhodovulum sulfidophilum]
MTELPKGWEHATLADVCQINPRVDKKTFEPDDIVAFVPMPAVEAETGRIDVSETRTFNEVKQGYTPFMKGDVLFAKITPCMENGKMAIVPEMVSKHGFGSTEFHVLRPLDGIASEYIYHAVSNLGFRYHAEHNMTGAVGQKRVPAPVLEDHSIGVPPTNEQRRIVERIEVMFDEIDHGVENLKKARATLGLYRQSLLKSAFEGHLTADWRARNADKLETPETLLARIQKERDTRYKSALDAWQDALTNWRENGEEGKKPPKPKVPEALAIPDGKPDAFYILPKGWSWVPLEWLLTAERRPMTTGPFGTMLKKQEHQKTGVPVLGIENIGSGRFLPGNKIFVTTDKAVELSSFEAKCGDLVISRSGTVGEICEVPESYDGALISTNLLLVRPNHGVISSAFFVNLFQGSSAVRKQIKELCKGSSREFLNQSILRAMKYPLCSTEEQAEITRILDEHLSAADALEAEIDAGLTRAEALRQSILKQAFSGKLVPQDPKDEPAATLLARIRAEKGTKPKKRKAANA